MDNDNHPRVKNFYRFRPVINQVSPSFCLAKWLQVTLYLQTGENHSCHHPRRHVIPLEELEKDLSALHNTAFKKEQRQLMLNGQRPPECHYCWNIEDADPENISDRIIKSADDWAFPHLQRIRDLPAETSVAPTYLEVSFGFHCQFSCAYCQANVSSSIWKEMEDFGPYPVSETNHHRQGDIRVILGADGDPLKDNPYVSYFWQWFPTIASELKVFRVTGGEPLINQNTFRLLDYLYENPLPQLELSINSNLGVPEQRFALFLEKIKLLKKEKKIGKFTLFTSVDSSGAQAEYIRYGLDYSLFFSRVEKFFQEIEESQLAFMVTMNLLSLPGFIPLLQDVLKLKEKYVNKIYEPGFTVHDARLIFDVSYLENPRYLSLNLADEYWREHFDVIVEFMKKNPLDASTGSGFSTYETGKMQRIAHWLRQSRLSPQERTTHLQDFYQFINEYDRRKGTVFLQAFPEFKSFYHDCLMLHFDHHASV